MGLEWLEFDPGKLPKAANSYRGDVIVASSARCLWRDLERIPNRTADVLCVNDAAFRFPGRIEHVYSSHADILTAYRALRSTETGPCYTHSIVGDADCLWPWPGHGPSGLNGIYTALGLGYGRAFVCGMPMDNTGHFNDPPSGHWLEQRHQWRAWSRFGDAKNFNVWQRAIENVFEGRVTFMSGRFA